MFSTFLLKQVNSFFFLADEILVIFLCDFLNKVIILFNKKKSSLS